MTARTAAIALFGVALAWRFLTFTGFTNDHYAHLALARQMLLGDRPIRDFADPGWPLQYLVSAAAWRLVDGAMVGEWALAALAFAAGAAFTMLAAHRLSGSIVVAIVVTTAEILISPRTYSYPKILLYAAAGWMIVSAIGRPSRSRLVVLGLIVALAFLFRHDHGLYIGAATAVYVVLASYPDGIRRAARAVGTLGAATVVFLTPWAVYVEASGGIASYFRVGLEFSRAEANATLLDFLPTFGLAPSVFSAANADAWLFWLYWTLPLVCAVIVIVRAIRGQQQWPGELAAVTGLSVLALCANVGFVRHLLRTRLPDAIVPAVLLGAWALGLCWRGRWSRPVLRSVARVAALAVVALSLVAIGLVASVSEQIDRTSVTRGAGPTLDRIRSIGFLLRQPHRQNLAPPGRVSETLMPFYAYLDRCSSRTDRLIVTNQSPDVPVLAGRKFAGYDAVMAPAYSSVSGQRQTLERLRANPALFVVVIERPEFRESYPVIDRYMTDEYEPMAILSGALPEGVPILVHRARTPIRTDANTGWPCFR